MLDQRQFTARNSGLKPLGAFIAAGAAFFALSTATPAFAASDGIEINGLHLNFGDDGEDLFEQLVALDADDIQDIREEMADALEEIADAMDEIEDARAEAKATPGGGAILNVAFSAASVAITTSVDAAFDEVRTELDQAARRLSESKDTLNAEEFAETQEAIDVIRTGLADIEAALDKLVAAMKA